MIYTIIDEDKLVEGLTYGWLKQFLEERNVYLRIGWYFQQFLKMGFANSKYCNEYYLSWDSDTLPLSRITFFEEEHPIFTMKKEYHKPYFNTMYKLLGLKKTVGFSFIFVFVFLVV